KSPIDINLSSIEIGQGNRGRNAALVSAISRPKQRKEDHSRGQSSLFIAARHYPACLSALHSLL
ncbi:hypothetical protein, partial [Kluyvera intermedia]|uniref:hypothetical protein n=1 Tax=Kluyvera intermedia TaxID=61648 RepID=UPI00370A635E